MKGALHLRVLREKMDSIERAEDIRNQVEEFVRKDVQLQDGEKFFISKEVVHKCWHKIWRWISVSTVGPHLLKYGVVKDSMDLNLHNPYFTPQQKAEQLLHLATQSGECGYHILYMCIRDDDENPLGHASAVEELVKEARSLRVKVPSHLLPSSINRRELTDSDDQPQGQSVPSTPLQKPRLPPNSLGISPASSVGMATPFEETIDWRRSVSDPSLLPTPSSSDNSFSSPQMADSRSQSATPRFFKKHSIDSTSLGGRSSVDHSPSVENPTQRKGSSSISRVPDPSARTSLPDVVERPPIECTSLGEAPPVVNIPLTGINQTQRKGSQASTDGNPRPFFLPGGDINPDMSTATETMSSRSSASDTSAFVHQQPQLVSDSSRWQMETPQAILAKLESCLGNFDKSCEDKLRMNKVDIQMLGADDLMDIEELTCELIQFVVACLNSRRSTNPGTGALIAGIDCSGDGKYGLTGLPLEFHDLEKLRDSFEAIMERRVQEMHRDKSTSRLTSARIFQQMVGMRVYTVRDSTSKKTVNMVLLVVLPDWTICRDYLFVVKEGEGHSRRIVPCRSGGLTAQLKGPQISKQIEELCDEFKKITPV